MYLDGKPANPIITLVLKRGTDDLSLAASGTHYRAGYHKTFTVTGKSGTPQEDGKISVELKFVYVAIWIDAELTGVFDPEEKSFRGTIKYGSGTITGDFVFKRNPDFVRFYPSPSTITARKRWEFATMAVLDRIRSDSWSPRCLLQRIKDGKRYMEFSMRGNYHGKRLDANEEKEYYDLFSSLRAGDARFYASLITIKLASVPIQYVNKLRGLTPYLQGPLMQPHRMRRLRQYFGRSQGSLYGLSQPGHRRSLFGTGMSQIYRHVEGEEGSDRST